MTEKELLQQINTSVFIIQLIVVFCGVYFVVTDFFG